MRIADAEPRAAAVGSFLALGRDGGRLFVLSPPGVDDDTGGRSLAVLDPVTLRRLGSVALPDGLVVRSIQVGPRTGRLYVSGNSGAVRTPGGASVCVGEPAASPRWRCAVLRRPGRLHWLVLDTSLSPDERRLVVSYHGSDTTGADWVATATLARCQVRSADARATCLSLHGRASFLTADRLLATTGEGPLLELSLAGARVGEWELGLAGNHVMEFAISPEGTHAAAVGPCGYRGGLSLVNLRAGTVSVHGYPDTLCADRITFLDARTVALARNRFPVPQGLPARLDVVDAATGRIRLRHSTASEVLDLLAD